MKCRDARRALERRIDERLALEVGFELDAHLEDCAACRERLQRGDALDEAIARMPEPPLERLDVEHSVSAIRARIEAERGAAASAPPRRAPLRRTAALKWAALAAAASLALAIMLSERDGAGAPDGSGASSPAVAQQSPHDDGTNDAPTPVASANEIQPSRGADSPQSTTTPAPVPSPSDPGAAAPNATAPGATAPGATALRNPNPVDAERLERARGEVRGRLLAAAEGLGASPSDDEITAFVVRFDAAASDLRSGDWPVLRLVERALRDGEADVAGPAARYLGRRGDRATWSRLEDALEREDLQFTVVDALADAGEDGLDGLASALRRPDVREAALLALRDAGSYAAAARIAFALTEERAATLEGISLEAPESGTAANDDLLEALIAFDERAIGALIALGKDGALQLEELVAALERMPAAPEWLADALGGAGRRDDPDTLVRCATRLNPEAAAEWLVDHARDRRHGALVRSELPRVAGEPGVAALIALAKDQRTPGDTLDALVGRSLEVDAQRFASHARLISMGHQVVLAELLIGAEDPLAIHGLRVLAQVAEMPEEIRRDVILAIGEVGDDSDVDLLLALFANLQEHQRMLAAGGLVALHALGGDSAVQRALEGAEERDLRNLLGLLRRRKAGSGTTSSLYKLARGLRPFLSARDQATQDSSS